MKKGSTDLAQIRTFPQLVKYLRDELDWPIESDDFEELVFEYTPEELGIESKSAAKIQAIKRLRPLSVNQPWGVFFIKFEPKRLPVVALRRILNSVVHKKRASANPSERAAWNTEDLLFISNYGEGDARQITFAHFSQDPERHDLPTLRLLGWDNLDTVLHIDDVSATLNEHLVWPNGEADVDSWREKWSSAFTVRYREVITTSKELAIRLAALAGAIRDRIRMALEIETETGPLTKLMKSFQVALVHDLDSDGFADMYAQTVAYGLLSARIANPRASGADDSRPQMPVTNPFLKDLVDTFLHVGGRGKGGGAGIDFDELGVSEVVELLDAANMEKVILDFGDRNPQEDPVIHFYELFLKEYDAKKRMQRGVFYTPRPVVSHIVRAVHDLLQTEFGLSDGLADTSTWGQMAEGRGGVTLPEGLNPTDHFVTILDPATGTGTFLVEVIDVVHRTLVEKWNREGHGDTEILNLWNDYVPEHLLPRLHGYELLMAPYAIAHLKVGLKLRGTGYRFDSDERVRIYLTNALEPASDVSQMVLEGFLPALAHEAHAVNEIKRRHRFTVVIGNPPYAGHSLNNQVAWIVDKVYDYKRGYPDLQKPGQAKWLQDDYVKFLRLAEWHIERSDRGVIGFITNHSWLDNPTFKGMRHHFLNSFQHLAVLDLHGNANKKETAPDGTPDENVFEIKQGVAISLLGRRAGHGPETARVERGDLFGTDAHKYAMLMARSALELSSTSFLPIGPELIFASLDDARKREYDRFIPLPALMDRNGDPAPGIVTTHDEFAISFNRKEQIQKVEALLTTRTEPEARRLFRLCSQKQWIYKDAKQNLRVDDWKHQLVPILYRPFDRRWTVYNRYVAVHRRERVSRHLLDGHNLALSIPRVSEIMRGWEHVFCTDLLIQHHTVSLKEVNYLFPLWLEPEWPETQRLANFSPRMLRDVAETTGLANIQHSTSEPTNRATDRWDGRGDLNATFGPRDLFDFIYAILHSPSYRDRYADFLKSDFARVPLTPTGDLFRELALLGAELVALHLMRSSEVEHPVTTYTGPNNPAVERVGWSDETVWLDAAATKTGQPATPGSIGFHGVPENVWNFHIGGYQVCEKWLKDRKERKLSKDDIAHYQKIIVALSATIRFMAEIDEVIEAHGGWPDAFATSDSR